MSCDATCRGLRRDRISYLVNRPRQAIQWNGRYWCRKVAAQYPPRLVQLGLGVAARTFQHRCNFAMIEAVNVVKEKDTAIAGRHGSNRAVDGQTVDDAGLCQIAGAETATGTLFWNVFHQLIK